jgi:hypothetical protein
LAKLKEINFVPAKSEATDNRREKIYLYYIEKNFPGAKITKEELGTRALPYTSISIIL